MQLELLKKKMFLITLPAYFLLKTAFGSLFWRLPLSSLYSTTSGLEILHNEFDLRLEPIAFDAYFKWRFTQKAKSHFAVSLKALLNFCFNS